MRYPRVLVVALGRINAADTSNNGLLLRNLFEKWPPENVAQVYSSGAGEDDGFFGRYYRLGAPDRSLGQLFYLLKGDYDETARGACAPDGAPSMERLRVLGSSLLVRTGVHEMAFRPRLSRRMIAWIGKFKPDIVFAQGYNLTFAWLPLMLSRRLNLPLVYYPTDDWPRACYRTEGSLSLLSWFARGAVAIASRDLAVEATVNIAFNRAMEEEYMRRYDRTFSVLMHGDRFSRFLDAGRRRSAPTDVCEIVSTGALNPHRWPLVEDLEKACEVLESRGCRARGTIYAVAQPSASRTRGFRHVRFEPCPSHNELPAVLRGADILFLPERFDNTVDDVRLSISSKAHLFMFSGRPIVVYSHPRTGVARYAENAEWAAVVNRRDPQLLARALERLAWDREARQRVVSAARETARRNHYLPDIQWSFRSLLCAALV